MVAKKSVYNEEQASQEIKLIAPVLH